MKKLILAALAVGSIATAQAQKAGSLLVYGDVGISRQSTTLDDGIVGTTNPEAIDFGFRLIPGVGYQINNWWTVGMNLGIGYNRTSTDPETVEERNRQFLIGPFVRMTMPINKTFFLFHQANISYIDGKRTIDNPSPVSDEVYDTRGFAANIVPAVGINFTKCMALNFSFGGIQYTWAKESNDFNAAETTTSKFDFTWGRQFNLGISANLGGRRAMKGHREPGMEHRRHMDMDDDDDVEIKVKKKKVVEDEE